MYDRVVAVSCLRARTRFIAVSVLLATAAMAVAAPAHALLSKTLQKTTSTLLTTTTTTTTTTTDTLTTTTTAVVEPVVQTTTDVLEPVVDSTTGTVFDQDVNTRVVVKGILKVNVKASTEGADVIPSDYDPIAPLANLLGGQGGLPSTLEELLCPPVSELMERVKTVDRGLISDGVTSLVCSTSLLDYRFYTQFKRADGSMLVREHSALLGVPTPLDVDEDVAPDLIGTITLTDLNNVGLLVDRVAGETAQLPVAVEAVLDDTSRGVLGREHVAFGYDSRDDRAPGRFIAATKVDTILRPAPEFELTVSQQDRGERIALLGGIFDGALAQRKDPAEVRIGYERSPDLATIGGRFGNDEAQVRLTTNRPGPTTISGRIVDGAEAQDFAAKLTDLPNSFEVAAKQQNGGVAATMKSSAPIGRIEGAFSRVRSSTQLLSKSVLDLHDVPVGVQVALSGQAGEMSTTGGPIGHVRVGTANGEPRFLEGERAYAYVDDDGTVQSVAAAVPGVRSAKFALAGAPRVSAEIASTPFKLRMREPGRTIGADVLDLPSRFDIALDLEAGTLAYDGHGDGIERILLTGDSETPFFARATKLRGTIEGIPAAMTAALALGERTGEFRVDGGGAIRKVELLASNGPEDLPAGTGQGAVYRDVTGGDYLVSARILDLRRLAFATGDAISLDTHTAGGPFSLAMQTDAVTADADIRDLPAKTALTAALEEGTITFHGRTAGDEPAGIERLDLELLATQPLFGRADRVRAHVEDIPADLSLQVAQSGDGADVVASDAIGLIELVAANRAPEAGDLPANGEQGAKLTDLADGEYVLGARIRRLRRLSATLGTPLTLTAETAGGPFGVRVTTDDLRGHLRIEDLPQKLTAALNLDEGTVAFQGRDAQDQPQGIERLTVDLDSSRPLFGRATDVHALIEDIASDLQLQLAPSAGGVDFTASDPIGLIEVVARNSDIADPQADLPAGGEQGAKLTDLGGGDYVAAARVRSLRKLAAAIEDNLVSLTAHTAGGPFGVRIATDELRGHARIEDLPAKLAATVDLDAGRLTVDSRDADDEPQRIGRVTLDLTSPQALFGRASDVAARIEGIPSGLVLDIAQDGSGAHLEGNEPIDLIELVAANRAPEAGDLPVGGEQGAKLTDLSGGDYVVAARVRKLRKLAGSFADAGGRLTAHTEGGPFGLRVTTDDLRGHARVEDLPAKLDLALDLEAGRLAVQGRDADDQPQGIDRIQVDLDSSQPVFGRATDVHGNIEDIPSDVTLDIAQGGTGVGIVADDPIGLIEVVANDGDILAPDALLPADGEQGAIYRDTDHQFQLSARVRELEQLQADLAGALTLRAKTAGGPFRVIADTAGIQGDVQLRDLPADVEASFDPGTGAFGYRGRDAGGAPAGVGLVTLDFASEQPLFGRATHVNARIEDLAAEVDLQLDTSTGLPTAGVEASSPITRLELVASETGGLHFPEPLDDGGVQGAVYTDREGQPFLAALRVLDLRKIAMSFGESMSVESQTAGSPFAVEVDTESIGISSRIDDLPANAKLTLDLEEGQVHFEGSDSGGAPKGIDLLTIQGRLSEAFLGRADLVDARIEKLPPVVDLGFSQEGGKASLTASEPVQLIELFAWESGNAKPTLGSDQGALLHDRAGEPFQLAARVRQLERLTVDFADAVELSTKTAGGLFDADVRTDTLDAQATIDELPSELTLGLDLESGQLRYRGSSPIDRIYAAINSFEPVFLGATTFDVDLKQVPEAIELGLGTETESIRLAADNPIGQVDIRAKSVNRQFPAVPAGEPGAILHATGGEMAMALRAFQLKLLDVSLDPIGLEAEMQGGRTFTVDAKVDLTDEETEQTSTLELNGLIDKLPSNVKLAFEDIPGPTPDETGGSRLVLDGSAPIQFVRLNVRGFELLPGADRVDAELNDLPQRLSVSLPTTGSLARIEARNAGGDLTQIGQVRLAASNGSKALPAFVSDAQYNGNPGNASFRDRLEFDNSPTAFGVALRLTGAKLIDVNLDPIALTLEQQSSRTRPIDIDATIPNSEAGRPATRVTGRIDKPSARTVLGVDMTPGEPTALNIESAAPIASIPLKVENLGTIPLADLSLANVPTKLSVCLDTSSACRPTAPSRVPVAPRNVYINSANSNFSPNYTTITGSFTAKACNSTCQQNNPFTKPPVEHLLGDYVAEPTPPQRRTPVPQSWNAAGLGRPYQSTVSMSFDDFGTSGTSSNVNTMVTLNATIDLNDDGKPCLAGGDNSNGANCVSIANLRFHTLALDLGEHPTAGAFPDPSILLSPEVPRLYMQFDSMSKPFVMNRINYPPQIERFRIGTDSSPASADRRLLWIPGPFCTGAFRNSDGRHCADIVPLFNTPVGDNRKRDARTSGSLSCGGAAELIARVSFLTINLLDFFGTQIIPVCGSGQGG